MSAGLAGSRSAVALPFGLNPFFAITLVSVLALAFPAPPPATAGTYHVAQGHPLASDVNPGTGERPWKTLARAAEALQPGDAACIHEGTYREAVRPAWSGTAEKPRVDPPRGEHPRRASPATQ